MLILSLPEVSEHLNIPFLDAYKWKTYEGAVVVGTSLMSEFAIEVHMAASPGTHGVKVMRCLKRALKDIVLENPTAKVVVGPIQEYNKRAMRVASSLGFVNSGMIPKLYGDHGLVFMTKEL